MGRTALQAEEDRGLTELYVRFSSDDPQTAWAESNWPSYVIALSRCEAFDQHINATFGKQQLVGGTLDITKYEYLGLRSGFSTLSADARYEAERDLLPDLPGLTIVATSPELKDTVVRCRVMTRYWAEIETDMPSWLRKLANHDYAVMMSVSRYPETDYMRCVFMIPRSLLVLRPSRPRQTERKAEAREAMQHRHRRP
jgi:hypothetical protein